MNFGILLCSLGTFGSAIHIFNNYSHSMFNIQQYYATDLFITLSINDEKNFLKFEAKILTSLFV